MLIKKKLNHLIITKLLFLSSCKQNQADIDRAIETFLMFILQVASIILLGISSMVLCITGSNKPKPNSQSLIGGILLTIFTLVTIFTLIITLDIKPKRFYIYFAFFIDSIIIFVGFFFLLKKSKDSKSIDKVIKNNAIDEFDDIK